MGIGNAKALLCRLRKLERANVPPLFKFIGSSEELAVHAQAGVEAGIYDPRDMPLVVNAVRRWVDASMH